MIVSKRILIIDDEPSARDLLRRILEPEGYTVVEARDGVEGLRLFQEATFDLVVTDMVMPFKDGLQTILDLRGLVPELPVVAISGGGVVSKERYLTIAGYLDRVITLAKPFAIKALTDAVAKLLRQAEEEKEGGG
jgi:DNA-binding NtrC family response regulator